MQHMQHILIRNVLEQYAKIKKRTVVYENLIHIV